MTTIEERANEAMQRALEIEPVPTNGWIDLILGGTMMHPYNAKDECKNCGKHHSYYVCYESGFFCSWSCYEEYHKNEVVKK
jgi:hypothetical protein